MVVGVTGWSNRVSAKLQIHPSTPKSSFEGVISPRSGWSPGDAVLLQNLAPVDWFMEW